ncbi:MAG: Gfo/Idh/MocA family oxidoreductase [Fimbriimonadaceae bacterium]|nr:Gfo/Idh/MocA family oxidoreductase [Fimbriimonadaceae bacterium]
MRHRVGLLGAGGMGRVHAAQYVQMPDVDLHFFDRRPERAAEFAARFGAVQAESAEALIDAVEVVDVCLPTDKHRDFGMMAIDAGRHVVMEKPIARDLAAAEALVSGARAKDVKFMPAQVVRFFPEYRLAHDAVQSGQIGRPAAVRMRRGGPAPKGSSNWFMDHARSGGVLLDLAIHDFDWIAWTFGPVHGVESRSVAVEVGSGPDYALTTLTTESGVVAHVESTWMDPSGFRTHFEVAGSEGLLQYDMRETATVRVHQAVTEAGDMLKVQNSPRLPHEDPYFLELRGFLDAVRDGTEPPVTGEEGIAALKIALAAIESAKRREYVTVASISSP